MQNIYLMTFKDGLLLYYNINGLFIIPGIYLLVLLLTSIGN